MTSLVESNIAMGSCCIGKCDPYLVLDRSFLLQGLTHPESAANSPKIDDYRMSWTRYHNRRGYETKKQNLELKVRLYNV